VKESAQALAVLHGHQSASELPAFLELIKRDQAEDYYTMLSRPILGEPRALGLLGRERTRHVSRMLSRPEPDTAKE
jgi:hypothetical protein